jgi:hypothetical protein
MTRAQITAQIDTAIASNIRGEISAADVRAVLKSVAESYFNTDSDKVQFSNLADAVLTSFQGGLDPTKYQGPWTPATNTPTIAAAGGGNTGQWYIVAADGTATGNAAGTYVYGDRIQSNGSAWLKQPAPATIIPDLAITFEKLAASLRDAWRPQFSADYVYAIVDSVGRVALGIKPTGELFGKLPIEDNAVTTTKIANAAVTLGKLATEVSEKVGEALENETGYVWAVVDSAKRIGLGVKRDGSVTGNVVPKDGSITKAQLVTAVAETIPDALDNSSGYAYAIVDSVGRIAFGITPVGTVVAKLSSASLADKAVTEPKLSDDVARAAVPHGSGRFEVESDDGWRGRRVGIPARTSTVGHLFSEFAPMTVRSVTGINTTGTTLEFRRSAGLSIRGKRYRGTWDATTGTPDAAPLPGDWWNCTVGGSFFGITWVNGDRILALDNVISQGAQYIKGLQGEMWYLGEFTPASHTPSNIRNGDVWQASASGTFSTISFAANDLLVREQGAWGKIAGATVTSIANGVFFSFDCRSSREIEVRRSDKSTTRVGLLGYGVRTMKTDRSTDALVMWGDSMVATGGLNTSIQTLLNGRAFTSFSYPGASSEHVLAMMRKEARGADIHRGKLHIIFAATNNATDIPQTREVALAMADIAGARDNRILFLSVLGQQQCTWNGSRIVVAQFEDAFASTGIIYDLEQWYTDVFPGGFLNTRTALLSSASAAIPALLFPGLNEAGAAATYGAVPLSYFLDYASKPWVPTGLIFTGYHSTAGVPTGGSDGDYKIRTSNGTIGALQVRWAGAWTEHTWDMTHMNAAGNAALAAAVVNFLNTNKL